ncbi:cid11 [Symbiodinium natans]|uniref:Cid11 protein n=1 Tax=Symbiodinium natans TaxID=878477 RepID=A0A812S7Q9_9DINO|nr:cid11 [Symbiodinium natans]
MALVSLLGSSRLARPLLLRRCAASAPLQALGPNSPSSSSRTGLAQVTRTGEDKPASLSAWWRRRQDGGSARALPPEVAQRLSQELAQYAADLQPSPDLVAQKDEFLKRLQLPW